MNDGYPNHLQEFTTVTCNLFISLQKFISDLITLYRISNYIVVRITVSASKKKSKPSDPKPNQLRWPWVITVPLETLTPIIDQHNWIERVLGLFRDGFKKCMIEMKLMKRTEWLAMTTKTYSALLHFEYHAWALWLLLIQHVVFHCFSSTVWVPFA